MTNNPTSLSPPLSDEDARVMAEAYGVPLEALEAYEKYVQALEQSLAEAALDRERLVFVEEQLKQIEESTCDECGRTGCSLQSTGEHSLCAACRDPEPRKMPLFSVRQLASKAAEKANRRYQEYVLDRQREGLPVQAYWDYVVDAALLAISTEGDT